MEQGVLRMRLDLERVSLHIRYSSFCTAAFLQYLSTDQPYPRGELLIKGPVVFARYHKNPKATKEVLDEEGWFSSGDIAEIDTCGRVKIVDRIKNVMKLAQG